MGRLSCRRYQRRQNLWPSPACFAAACEAEQPGRMHSQQLNTHIHTSVTYAEEFLFSFIMTRHELDTRDLPLQFFAILNMLAALAYISQASSTLWFPLWAKGHQGVRILFTVFHFNIGTKLATGCVLLKCSPRQSRVVDLFILQKKGISCCTSQIICVNIVTYKTDLWTSAGCSMNQFNVFTSPSLWNRARVCRSVIDRWTNK